MTRLSVKELQKRYHRLDTLRVLTEGYEIGEGYSIYQKASRAENQPDEYFTGIIRLTNSEKEFLSYILDENPYLIEYDKEVLRYYIGG